MSSTDSLAELYPSPRSSSITVKALLLPAGGLISSDGLGGVGKLPMKSYSQGNRAAASHAILVQTPHVRTNMATLALLVQCYDAFGHSDVSTAMLEISASLHEALPHQTVTAYQLRGPKGAAWTRRYYATLPRGWFGAASTEGSTATVSARLLGGGVQTADFLVYGMPSWFAHSISPASIAAFVTSDAAGNTPAQSMRLDDTFYLQLYANTGGAQMSTFEVKIVESTSVCQVHLPRIHGPTPCARISLDAILMACRLMHIRCSCVPICSACADI